MENIVRVDQSFKVLIDILFVTSLFTALYKTYTPIYWYAEYGMMLGFGNSVLSFIVMMNLYVLRYLCNGKL